MKITKFTHSCLLVEDTDRVAIFDPGVFTWESGVVDVSSLPQIDRIVITHQHPDHCHPEFIQALLDHSPHAQIVTHPSVQQFLRQQGVEAVMRESTQCTQSFTSSHESIESLAPGGTPEQTGFHFKGRFTHPGDSHSFQETKEVVAMAFVAPWGSVMDGVDAVLRLGPKHVVPVHDWFYSDDAKKWLYDILAGRLEAEGIELHPLAPGESIEI